LCLIGSFSPDIDHPKSKVGQWFKPIGWLFEHRGFFHSIFPIIFLIILSNINPLFVPFMIGYLSHILIDMTTKQGILFVHPFINIRISGFIRTGSFLETIIFLVITLTNLILITMI
ncbi:metal-dependent hydrolase, partial [Candidatus Woesearchaeota archaeon]|nr:metal-dependent hydrolase [Candidatus Woesearchaeota archaeon]